KRADDFGVFVQLDIYPFTEKFELITGARYDMHDSKDDLAGIEYNESAFNPRIAARYFLSDNFTLRGSFGSGFRVPYLFSEDLHLCASSPRIYKGSDLKPEKASSFSLGTDYMTTGIEMGVGFFYTKISDKV
ncbi:TonB-dependent receptor, partial [bacterium]|nr:TonB-dependent receptor [bacterium]